MRRVLIVDDEFTVLRVLERMCVRLGFEVEACKTAEEAMKILQSCSSFDLILTDIILPGISGLAFLEWLQKQGLFKKKVVIMTAYPKSEFVDFALRHGAVEVLTKPFNDLGVLTQKLRSWISDLDIQPNTL